MIADKANAERVVVRDVVYRRHVPEMRGHGPGERHRSHPALRRHESLSQGALTIPGYTAEGWYMRIFAAIGIDTDKPIRKYTKKELHLLFTRTDQGKVEKLNLTYEGLIPRIRKSFSRKDVDAMNPHHSGVRASAR
jgi:hypothetical protein